jgi:GT2 family glycosyltransferase
MKAVPVIVLQYGRFELTEQCIASLRGQTHPVQIFLVDGASPGRNKRDLTHLASLADRHLFLEENLGYAGGNNRAIAQVLENGADFFFVLNNDTVLDPHCVEALVEAMERHPRAAQVGCQVLYADGRLQAAGARLVKPIWEPQLIGHLKDRRDYLNEAEVGCAPGMAMLIRTQAVREVGLIPERYFMYGEDVDWSLSFRNKGWEVWYCPTAVVTHFESASLGNWNFKKAFYMTRANWWLAKRWTTPIEWRSFMFRFLWKLIKQSVRNANHPRFVLGLWCGWWAGVRGKEGSV